ncbi:hypothetical protein BHE74_00015404 [Ensete ventricosum]|nr:hypothetical protein BHE74_00015404 [Ensete ventricosum]
MNADLLFPSRPRILSERPRHGSCGSHIRIMGVRDGASRPPPPAHSLTHGARADLIIVAPSPPLVKVRARRQHDQLLTLWHVLEDEPRPTLTVTDLDRPGHASQPIIGKVSSDEYASTPDAAVTWYHLFPVPPLKTAPSPSSVSHDQLSVPPISRILREFDRAARPA